LAKPPGRNQKDPAKVKIKSILFILKQPHCVQLAKKVAKDNPVGSMTQKKILWYDNCNVISTELSDFLECKKPFNPLDFLTELQRSFANISIRDLIGFSVLLFLIGNVVALTGIVMFAH